MTDPKRWTEELADATSFEHDLLRAGQQMRLPDDQKREIWASIAMKCPMPAAPQPMGSGVGASEAVPAVSPLGVSVVVKGLVVLVAVSGLVGVGHLALRERPADSARLVLPGPTRVGVADAAPNEVASSVATGSSAPQVPAVSTARPQPRSSAPPRVAATASLSSRASQLREESRAVLEARRRLRSGDPRGALRLLRQARARFPHGALRQEREALAIEALAKSGSRGAAQQRADAFLRDHPRSPHAADVRAHGDR